MNWEICDVFGYESSQQDVTPLAIGSVKRGPELIWHFGK